MTTTQPPADLDARYARQLALAQLGPEGQRALGDSTVLVVGCGALGSHLANYMARVGVGALRLVDHDVVEPSNLPRQLLFDEHDAARRVPKARAAAARLARINSQLSLDARVAQADRRNIEDLLEGADVVLDGTDNMHTRYVINDACVKHRRPWVYGGVVGTSGLTLTVQPGSGPCLRCLFPTPAEEGALPSPETHGVLGTVPALIACLQATAAVALLCGHPVDRDLLSIDLWSRRVQRVTIARDPACPACGGRVFEYL